MGLTRDIHPDTLAALQGVFYPVLMIYLDWPDGAVRAHSGVGTIEWDGDAWLGVGEFGGIEIPAEAPGLAATQASLTLVGAPDDLFALLSAPIRNRHGEVLFAVTTEPGGNVLIGEPVSLFAGYMDAMRYRSRADDEITTSMVQVDLGSGPGARSMASVVHSYEDQIAQYPGDTAGRHLINVEAEAENLSWPAS